MHKTRHYVAWTVQKAPILMFLPYKIMKFFQAKYSIGVLGLVFNESQQILLVEHVYHPYRPWGLPGGWLGRNEKPAKAVVRELKEELSLDVAIERVVLIDNAGRNHMDMAFLCTAQSAIGELSHELLSYGWFDLDNLPPLYDFHQHAIQQAEKLLENHVTIDATPPTP